MSQGMFSAYSVSLATLSHSTLLMALSKIEGLVEGERVVS